jgi:hypothetical protein
MPAESALDLGAGFCAVALGLLAAGGFAPDGRFPTVVAVLFTLGAALVAIGPRIPEAN